MIHQLAVAKCSTMVRVFRSCYVPVYNSCHKGRKCCYEPANRQVTLVYNPVLLHYAGIWDLTHLTLIAHNQGVYHDINLNTKTDVQQVDYMSTTYPKFLTL